MAGKKRLEINTQTHRSTFSMKSSHSHYWYELFYLKQGTCIFTIEDTVWRLKAGDVVIIAPDIPHSTAYEGDSIHVRVCMEASPEYLEPILKNRGTNQLFESILQKVTHPQQSTVEHLERLLQQIPNEQFDSDDFSPIMIANHVVEIITLLTRDFHQVQSLALRRQFNDNTIQLAIYYIEKNYSKKITLEDIADNYHLNASYFSKKFKNACGVGFKEYLTNIRIMNSEKLLLETRKTITEIAFECGFESSNYYGDAFRKKNHMSPSDFRRLKGIVQ